MNVLAILYDARRSGGALLIELLIVLSILGISLLGLLTESSTLIRGNRMAEQASAATNLAQAKLEELRGERFVDVSTGADPGVLGPDGTAGGVFTRSWTVTPTVLDALPAKQITVFVRWPEGSGNPVVTLSTLRVEVPQYAQNFPTVVERSWRRQ